MRDKLRTRSEDKLRIPGTLFETLELNFETKRIDRKYYKILKPKGILIIEVPAIQLLYDSYDKELKHYRRYNLKEL